MADETSNPESKPRKRGLTSVMLGWLAERMRRAENIKLQIESGTYQVDSEKIAASLVTPPLGSSSNSGQK
jgi:anti-sigma28 factor (negative regulator of flagellin synthesis)